MKMCRSLFVVMLTLIILLLTACTTKEQKIFNEALQLQQNEKYEDAIKRYSEIIDKYPESKFVANSNVKLNQCIDLIIKKGDLMASNKDYFKAVSYYEDALKFRPGDTSLKDKIEKTKKMVTAKNQESPKVDESKKDEENPSQNNNEEKEYKIALDVLNKYKGKKVHDFDSTSKILEMMTDWENAWESQNIEVYKAYYDESFIGVSGGKTMNYYQWINYKRELFNRYDRIEVDTALIDATLQGNNLKVKFEQWFTGYGVNPYSDHTFKELTIRYFANKGWMIVSEKPY
ncbi:tetratricopeptide repeat protein [Clostridium botulinum]|uniref:tetratricopeptide repeat protein n=1 Tax=Clostridium botulinum TaxID=1491 RepID=UPI0004DA209E|nr:hypothetical protein [Clostridium botulinum]KEH94186.1 hypothetical protein Z963_10925 [Clostridium botulinum C/D str. It1]